MKVYAIVFTSKARRQLKKHNAAAQQQIIEVIDSLTVNPRPMGYRKLTDRIGYRVKSGNYRIIYEITDNVLLIEIIAVGDRKNIYD